MDLERQVFETEATGWQRGLYDDIKATFRAPVVNWIFRTMMANEPDFLRYAWAQLKPLYTTRAFARFSVAYRDAVLSAVEGFEEVPRYRARDVDVSPSEFAQLRSQAATFDAVGPRLAVLFEVMTRSLRDEPVGEAFDGERAATEPYPEWLDRDRGAPPTMLDEADIESDLAATVEDVHRFHGTEASLPSIYRCLAQWPGYFERLWADVSQMLRDEAFEAARTAADELTAGYVSGVAYRPRLTPDELESWGLDEEASAGLTDLFDRFEVGPAATVVPALPIYAATLDAEGPRAAP